MKKIWIFVEGDSEEHFITHLIRNGFYETILQEKDLSAFIREDIRDSSHHKLYCENCQSVDKIPHRINEMYYLIEKSGSTDIFIVCDIEKLRCNTKRKNEIEKKLDEVVNNNTIRYAFFNPRIETAYWECPEVIKKIIEIEYKRKFNSPKLPGIALPKKSSYSQDDLKKLFKSVDLKYRETSFAKQFFPRVDYRECDNKVLIRLTKFLEAL